MSRQSAFVIVLAAMSLQACAMFGGGDDEHGRRHHQRYAGGGGNMNADCARLAPYVVNNDGSLSRSDLDTGLQAEFKKWDANGDGQLTTSESGPLNDHLRAMNVNASPVMDWNGDGRIAYDEFASGWRTMFDLCASKGGDIVTKADLARSPNVAPPLEKPKDERPEGASSPNAGHGY